MRLKEVPKPKSTADKGQRSGHWMPGYILKRSPRLGLLSSLFKAFVFKEFSYSNMIKNFNERITLLRRKTFISISLAVTGRMESVQ